MLAYVVAAGRGGDSPRRALRLRKHVFGGQIELPGEPIRQRVGGHDSAVVGGAFAAAEASEVCLERAALPARIF